MVVPLFLLLMRDLLLVAEIYRLPDSFNLPSSLSFLVLGVLVLGIRLFRLAGEGEGGLAC